MMDFQSFLAQKYFGNTVESYLWAIGILFIGVVFKRLISNVFSRIVFASLNKKTKAVGVESFVGLMTRPLSTFVVLLTFYFSFSMLTFPVEWNLVPGQQFGFRMVISRIFSTALVFSVLWIIVRLVDFFSLVLIYRASLTETKSDDQLIHYGREILKVILAVIGLFVAIAIAFNLDVVSLVTGLGIGGLAFALAAKETLENLIASFTIFLDSPFKVGDNIKVGTVEGTVESIGIRTTRVRSADKLLVTLPNKKMIDADLINENDREMRRVTFTIGLTYDAKPEQILSIERDIRNLLDQHEVIAKNFLVSFRQLSASSLDIFIQYFIIQPELEKYLEVNEQINIRIMEIVAANGCRFAFPSTSVYMENSSSARPVLKPVSMKEAD